ncbi:MAG TPA: bifunctional glutamate N-acetyltransferase/amino-acid acetyltransferase ArgJ [Actinomycetota bacterium]|nr:bifunctional glutamate N-acetyltransferase/amino-acid acetyltransferase ArgJ [Actinomycetota bacterium]
MAVRWPAGVASSGVAAGIKPAGDADLGLVALGRPAAWAGTFTRSGAAAAPVTWSRGLLGRSLRAIVVNSGNANACTGAAGEHAVAATVRAAASRLGCAPEEVAVASTGPIGVRLPVKNVVSGIPRAVAGLTPDVAPFADAILTTDTRRKVSRRVEDGFEVVGVGKGAAMLAPNMATMLAFLATDAVAATEDLQGILTRAVRTTFDRISVDACQSTNDSVFLVASGTAGEADPGRLEAAVAAVCADLAEQMVRDAEGGSKLVRIRVTGAPTEEHAEDLARGVAASALWRAAVHGADPNWGRIAAALGALDPALDMRGVSLAIGPEVVFEAGEPAGSLPEAAAAMASGDVVVSCTVGPHPTEVELLTTDLSPEYVTLNAGGMS